MSTLTQFELTQYNIDGAILLLNREELLKMIPKGGVTCELGVAAGGFSRMILDIIQPKKHYMVDMWMHRNRYDEAMYQSVLVDFVNELESGQATIIRDLSYRALASLPDASVDFIYIDTSHNYKDTRMELEVAKAKIKPTGIIAGHDYRVGRFIPEKGSFLEYGVIKAVNEFMVKYDFKLKYLTFEPNQFYSFAIEKIRNAG